MIIKLFTVRSRAGAGAFYDTFESMNSSVLAVMMEILLKYLTFWGDFIHGQKFCIVRTKKLHDLKVRNGILLPKFF